MTSKLMAYWQFHFNHIGTEYRNKEEVREYFIRYCTWKNMPDCADQFDNLINYCFQTGVVKLDGNLVALTDLWVNENTDVNIIGGN